jgi:hypothetical protein
LGLDNPSLKKLYALLIDAIVFGLEARQLCKANGPVASVRHQAMLDAGTRVLDAV